MQFRRRHLIAESMDDDLKRLGDFTVWNFDDMSNSFPCFMKFSFITKSEFIANSKLDFTAFQLRHHEPSNTLLIKAKIPADDYIGLSLGLFEPFVIIGFYLHQWSK